MSFTRSDGGRSGFIKLEGPLPNLTCFNVEDQICELKIVNRRLS